MVRLRLNGRSVTLLATAAGVVCLSTFANLASARIDTRGPHGRIAILHARFAPAVDLAAGDGAQRTFDLRTGGRTHVTLRVSASARSAQIGSPLVDPQLGLRLAVDRCSTLWKKRGAAYKCRGKKHSVLVVGPAVGRHALRRLARRTVNHLRLTVTLPQGAPNALQGQSLRLVYKLS
jgi:hypothetical protein